jgi:hypothetical protein
VVGEFMTWAEAAVANTPVAAITAITELNLTNFIFE